MSSTPRWLAGVEAARREAAGGSDTFVIAALTFWAARESGNAKDAAEIKMPASVTVRDCGRKMSYHACRERRSSIQRLPKSSFPNDPACCNVEQNQHNCGIPLVYISEVIVLVSRGSRAAARAALLR